MIVIQELVILGLLKDGPKHGYEIKRQIKDIMERFAVWEAESIYYPLHMMEKKGYVTKSSGRSGRRPEKFVYEITASGKDRFNELLEKSFVTIQRPTFNIDLSLYFLPHIKPEIVQRRLTLRLRVLKKIENGLKGLDMTARKSYPYHHLAIIEHNLELIQAEIKFISNFMSQPKLAFQFVICKNCKNNPEIEKTSVAFFILAAFCLWADLY